MIRIAITAAAFEAIAATKPLGSVSFENETNERGERLVDRRNCHRVPVLRYYVKSLSSATPFRVQ